MCRREFSVRVVSLVVLIFIVNYLAMKFYWYSSIWWLDMLMHFFGGFWLGLTLIWFSLPKDISLTKQLFEKQNFKLILKILLGVLIVGVLWEIFEVIVNNNTLRLSFNLLDTLSDICFDITGGSFAILYFLKRVMVKAKNNI